jgi:bifunctional non-homologous end joining protein LigD
VAAGDDGAADFERIRGRRHETSVFLYAFDTLVLDGDDLRATPLEARNRPLERLLRKPGFGLALIDRHEGQGPALYAAACAQGLEGIVSKRRGSRYRSGRCDDWVKAKNPASAAARRDALEDWGERR